MYCGLLATQIRTRERRVKLLGVTHITRPHSQEHSSQVQPAWDGNAATTASSRPGMRLRSLSRRKRLRGGPCNRSICQMQFQAWKRTDSKRIRIPDAVARRRWVGESDCRSLFANLRSRACVLVESGCCDFKPTWTRKWIQEVRTDGPPVPLVHWLYAIGLVASLNWFQVLRSRDTRYKSTVFYNPVGTVISFISDDNNHRSVCVPLFLSLTINWIWLFTRTVCSFVAIDLIV